jgi:hypothetical protein
LGDWNASGDGNLWGFNTTNIVCSDLINTRTGGCTTANVVFLNLLEAIGPETGIDKISTAGLSLRKFTPGQGYTTGEFFKRCNRVASRTV